MTGKRPSRPVAPEPFRELSWSPERFQSLATRAVQLATRFLHEMPESQLFRMPDPAQIRADVALAIPDEPLSDDEIMANIEKIMFQYSQFMGHPGFLGYIMGSGAVPAPVGDFLSAVLNQNVTNWLAAPGATEIETHITRWFAGLFGLPQGSGGIMTSGGAMANFIGLKVARDAICGFETRKVGLHGLRTVIYTSKEAHVVIDRAADMLGIGSDNVRRVELDAEFRMDTAALDAQITRDIAAGLRPVAVVATAGTTETGAIDPLPEIAAICKKHSLWLHVDAAYGGAVVLNDELRPVLQGIELADSIAFDPHKWMYISQSSSCTLFRDVKDARKAFAFGDIDYVNLPSGVEMGMDLHDYGPMFSRNFSSLKVWISLLAYGRRAYAERIAHDIRLAQYLGALVQDSPALELMTPVSLSICCFRYVPADLRGRSGCDEYLNTLNQRTLRMIGASGQVACSNAILNGKFCLRACVVNFRTEAAQMELLTQRAQMIGAKLDAEMRPEQLKT